MGGPRSSCAPCRPGDTPPHRSSLPLLPRCSPRGRGTAGAVPRGTKGKDHDRQHHHGDRFPQRHPQRRQRAAYAHWLRPAFNQMHHVLKWGGFAVSFYGWNRIDLFAAARRVRRSPAGPARGEYGWKEDVIGSGITTLPRQRAASTARAEGTNSGCLGYSPACSARCPGL